MRFAVLAIIAILGANLVARSPSVEQTDDEMELLRYKKQALQSIGLSAGALIDVDDDQLSSSFVDVSVGTGIPLRSFDNIVGVTPRARVDFIDAESNIDIPDELYQFELQFFYRRPIHERLSAMAIVSPSIRSDLTTSNNAFRVFALGLLNWQCVPERLTLSGGVVYLGRADLPILPAVGMTWTPSTRTTLDLRFPSSKLGYRLDKDGGRSEKWLYATAGIGGNTWSVTRRSDASDELSLRDVRIALGIEKRVSGGGGWFAESGYAFGRRIEYESDESEFELGDALVLRAGWRY